MRGTNGFRIAIESFKVAGIQGGADNHAMQVQRRTIASWIRTVKFKQI
jgi:hypothetical protein